MLLIILGLVGETVSFGKRLKNCEFTLHILIDVKDSDVRPEAFSSPSPPFLYPSLIQASPNPTHMDHPLTDLSPAVSLDPADFLHNKRTHVNKKLTLLCS